MVNQSKIDDPRFWKKWEESGAVGNISSQEYFVSTENTSGQITWTCHRTKADFERFYSSKMQDGSGDLISEAYPIIHYQGTNQEECQRINRLKARESYRNPLTFYIHALAKLEHMTSAEAIHRATDLR